MNDYLMARVNNIVYKDTLNTEISKSDISLLNSLPTKEVISTLRGIFDKEHDDVLNSRAYNAILSIRNFDKVQFLIDIFDGASIDWQIAHCKSFAQFHDPRAITKLCKILRENKDADVRYVAAQSLAEMGDYTAVTALEHAQKNDIGKDYEGFSVADKAREALLKIRGRMRSQ